MAKNKNQKEAKRKLSIFSKIGISDERDYFVENLSMLLASGMNILTAIESIRDEMKSSQMKTMLNNLKEDIDGGMSLSKALGSTGLFSDYMITLMRVGEESGRLPENLQVINDQQQKERIFRSKVRSATIYPVFVLSFTAVVAISLSWFILPRIASVFNRLNVEIPLITKLIISFGNFLNENGLKFIPFLLLVFIVLIFFLFSFKKTKFLGQSFLFRLPVVRKFISQIQISRFGFIVGSLLEAGLPVNQALDSLIVSTDFKIYKDFYKYLRSSIDSGNSFQTSFNEYKHTKRLIPRPIQQMIVAGEQSGRLSESLLKIGSNFENKVDDTAKNMTVVLEPVLLIIVGLAVAFVAIGVILPIYNLLGGINENTNPSSSRQSSTGVLINTEQNIPEQKPILLVPEEKKLPNLEIVSDNSDLIEVYDTASFDSIVLGQVEVRGIYPYLEVDANWYKLKLPGDEIVWIFGDYIKLINE